MLFRSAYAAPGAISISRNTVVSVDTTGGSFVRNNLQTPPTTRPETLVVNSLREGYNRRLPATVTQSDGTSSTVSEFITLPMRGMDFTPLALPAANQLILSATSSTIVP